MITIHATHKLAAKLPASAGRTPGSTTVSDAASAVVNNPLNHWHANLITLQRRNCVLLVHDATRFPLFIKGVVKADFANFHWRFADALMNTLLKLGANQNQLDSAADLLAPCQFDTQCNRSVQGTLNQMAGDVAHLLWFDQITIEAVNPYTVGAWLADRPCTVKGVKGCIWPNASMLELLSLHHSR